MGAIVNLVHNTGQGWTPHGVELPSVVRVPHEILSKVHGVWRRYRNIEMYSNPDNFLQLAGGHLLQHKIGDLAFIRFAAQLVMISTRILDCVEEQAKLVQACRQSVRAFDPSVIIAPKVTWAKRPRSKWISPSTDFQIRYQLKKLGDFIIHIFKAIKEVFVRLFTLTMKIMDAADSFSVSPTTRNQSLNTLFINSTRWIDKLATHKEQLLEGLIYHRLLIDDILDRMHSPWKAEQFISKVSKLLNLTEDANKLIKKASHSVGDLCRDLFKQGAFGFFSGIGLAKYTPDNLVPNAKLSWKRKTVNVQEESIALPLELLTRPSFLPKPQIVPDAAPPLPPRWTTIDFLPSPNKAEEQPLSAVQKEKPLSPSPSPKLERPKVDPLVRAARGSALQQKFNANMRKAQQEMEKMQREAEKVEAEKREAEKREEQPTPPIDKNIKTQSSNKTLQKPNPNSKVVLQSRQQQETFVGVR